MKKHVYIASAIVAVILIGIIAGGANINALQSFWNIVFDQTDAIRLTVQDNDSTSPTSTLNALQVADAVLDTTNNAINVSFTGAVPFNGAVTLDGGNVTVNDDSGDYDFRVETNGQTHAIFTDGGNDRVGIFNSAPAVAVDISGAVRMDGGNVTINEDSGDYDFKIETDSTDSAFAIDSGASTLDVNGLTVSFNQGSADVDFKIETDSTDNAFAIDSGNSTLNTDGLTFTHNQAGGDYDFVVESDNVTDALKVDAGTNAVQLGAWQTWEIATSTAESYSIASAGRASIHIQTYAGEATAHLMSALLTSPGAGAIVVVKTGGTNDVLIDTEGAETIDGGDTYDLDGSYESIWLTNDGTNWHILGGYLE